MPCLLTNNRAFKGQNKKLMKIRDNAVKTIQLSSLWKIHLENVCISACMQYQEILFASTTFKKELVEHGCKTRGRETESCS